MLAEAKAQGRNPDALVLGCTHYPLLRPLFEKAVPAGMKVIDSAEVAAQIAQRDFSLQGLSGSAPADQIKCFATDSVEKFERLGSRFLGRPTGPVQLLDLGG
jgi:glutamate racemase